jgi:hypothetical protein
MSVTVSYTKCIVDFIVKKRDTFRKKIEFNTKTDGVVAPDDITTSTFKVRIATKPDGGDTIKELTLGNGLSVESTNKLVLTISASDMNIAAGVYYYDVQRTYPDTTVVTRPQGRFIIEADVTL